jgi:hypothetical protein
VVAGIVVVLAGAAIALVIALRETTTPVDVETAVSEFRADDPVTDSTPVAVAALPEPGVYTYATSGRESIDALGGRHHDYPAESTITVRHEDCGAVHEWRPLRERVDETVVCPGEDGATLVRYSTHHEFFNMSDDREFVCEPGSTWYPAATEPDTTWTVRCASDDIDVLRTGTVTGLSRVDVGGESVEVLTIELHDEISGASTGINDRVVSVVPETGLIVELAGWVDVRNDSPIGDVGYQELYRINLQSLTPRR